MNPHAKYWLGLTLLQDLPLPSLHRLLREFGSAEEIFSADPDKLLAAGLNQRSVEQLREIEESLDVIEGQISDLTDEGIAILTLADDEYPANLRSIDDAPPVLFCRGTLLAEDRRAAHSGDPEGLPSGWPRRGVAIAGSRQASEAGLARAREVATSLGRAGVTVVSGMAAGIDSAAHEGALDAGARTIGVLGCGIRARLVGRQKNLAERVVESGALLSETQPNARTTVPALFARDRIVSGLSLAVVIIEAAAESGTMDTARHARKQGRPIFVVDWGGGDEATAGNRRLIQQGATVLPEGEGAEFIMASPSSPSTQLTLF